MHAWFATDFWMKANAEFGLLANGDYSTVVERGYWLREWARRLDDWCTYESGLHRVTGNTSNANARLERIGLMTKCIALHRHIEPTKSFLPIDPIDYSVGKKYQTGTGAEGGKATRNGVLEWLKKIKDSCQFAYGGGFSTRQDESIY